MIHKVWSEFSRSVTSRKVNDLAFCFLGTIVTYIKNGIIILSHICRTSTVSYTCYVNKVLLTCFLFNMNTTRQLVLATYEFKPFRFQVRINISVSVDTGGLCKLIVAGINSKDFQIRYQSGASFFCTRSRFCFLLSKVSIMSVFDQGFNHASLNIN